MKLPTSWHLYFSFFFFVLFAQMALGQEAEIEDKVVIIEKEAKLELPVANRNFQKIIFDVQKFETKLQEYSYSDVQFDLARLSAKIRVPTIPPDPLQKLYGNYIKAGFGNYTTPYLEAFVNSKRSEQFNYGIHAKHLSSKNGSVKSEKVSSLSGVSHNQADGFVHYFGDPFVLKSRASFTSHAYNYYGFNKALLEKSDFNEKTLKDSLKQRYNIFSLSAGIENKDQNSNIDYNAFFQYDNYSDRFKAKESEFLIDGGGAYHIDTARSIEVNALVSFSKRTDSTSLGRTFIQVKPAYVFTQELFMVKGGINIAYSNDTLKGTDKVHLYPTVHGEYVVSNKLLTLFGGLHGEMLKNTLKSFTSENPFLRRREELSHTNKALDLYIGGKGNVAEKVNYLLKLSYINYKNLYFFNNSRIDTSKFSIFYVRGSTDVINLNADVSYEMVEKLRLGVQSSFNGYSISEDTISAWHRPNVDINIYATYNLYQKINIRSDFYYLGGLKARNFITGKKEDFKLPSVIDLNLKIDYNVSSVFTAFIEFNNLLSRKYQLYQYYPVKGINILAGGSYSF